MNKLNLQARNEENGIIIIELSGEIDESNLDTLSSQIDPLFDDDNFKSLILDFSALNFINSKVLGYLASVYSRTAESKRQIVIANPSEDVMDIISLIGLSEIINVYKSVTEATENLNK